MIISGGIEIQGLHATVAPKRNTQAEATLEQYCFVPYDDEPAHLRVQSLADYTSKCHNYTIESFRKFLEAEKNGHIPNRSLIENIVENNKISEKTNIEELANGPHCGLAKILKKISDLSVDKFFSENVRSILSSSESDLLSDQLLSNFDKIEAMKPALDIVCDNFLVNKISVFEAAASKSAFYRQFIPWLETMRSVNYTAADSNALNKDAKSLGVKSSKWDLNTAKSAAPGQSHLVILKNVLHKQADIDEAFDKISPMVLDQGFVLVEEITDNFPLYLALEALSEKIEENPKDKNRKYGRYLSSNLWMEVFSRNGYDVIYRKSDCLLSTVFLLRKKYTNKVAPSVISIDDFDCSWVDDLKTRMKDLDEKPENTRVWLVAKNWNNGLVGMANCLRLETGGEKVRFLSVSNLDPNSLVPNIDFNSPEIQEIVNKDLYMNIFRDGKWGCFKHISICTGKL